MGDMRDFAASGSTPAPVSAVLDRWTSYEDFVATRGRVLFRTAYLLAGSRSDAEDLLQVALIKLYLAWRRAAAAQSTEAYARRILVNAFISGRRPRRHLIERLVQVPPDEAVMHSDPAERLALWREVVALPPRQRAVVVLRYYEDLTEHQIADVLGCAPGTVKSTASAALKALAERMGAAR